MENPTDLAVGEPPPAFEHDAGINVEATGGQLAHHEPGQLFNARILLVHAVEELDSERRLDLYVLGLAVSAVAETLIALRHMSRRLGVDPPHVVDLRPWTLMLFDQVARRRPRGFPCWWLGRPSGASLPAGDGELGERAR